LLPTAQDLAVADVPDGSVPVAHGRDPQAHRLHGAIGRAEVDDVADAVLVFKQHEHAREEVADEVLRAEADREPTMPAEARIGPSATPNSERIIATAIAPTRNELAERSTEPIVRARWARRGETGAAAPSPSCGRVRRLMSGRPGCWRRPRRAGGSPGAAGSGRSARAGR
jgi:hypothetical protein